LKGSIEHWAAGNVDDMVPGPHPKPEIQRTVVVLIPDQASARTIAVRLRGRHILDGNVSCKRRERSLQLGDSRVPLNRSRNVLPGAAATAIYESASRFESFRRSNL